MSREANKQVEIACEVVAQTPKALLIFDGKQKVWIPRSQITDECEGKNGIESIFISEWLATEKGLI